MGRVLVSVNQYINYSQSRLSLFASVVYGQFHPEEMGPAERTKETLVHALELGYVARDEPGPYKLTEKGLELFAQLYSSSFHENNTTEKRNQMPREEAEENEPTLVDMLDFMVRNAFSTGEPLTLEDAQERIYDPEGILELPMSRTPMEIMYGMVRTGELLEKNGGYVLSKEGLRTLKLFRDAVGDKPMLEESV